MAIDKGSLEGLRIDRSREPRRGRRRWWLLVLPVGLVLVAAWFMVRSGNAAVTVSAVTAVVSAPGMGGDTVLNASGYVTARRKATVSAKVTGKVVEVRIEEGMQVRSGQVLARLDASNLERVLALSEAQREVARSALTETEVRLDEARLNLRRSRRLVEEGVDTQARFDADEADVNALAARLARQKDDLVVAERRVEFDRQQLEDTVIRAPFDGVIVTKDAQPGEMISPVSAGGGFTRTGIGTVVDMSSLEIEVDVNESYINRVVAGQPVEAVLDAYPDWKIPARVIAIVPTADRQKATVRVRIGFEELDSRILPDMGVKVAFRNDSDRTANAAAASLRLPAGALRLDGEQEIVFVISDGRAERRAVRSGARDGDQVVIATGLSGGERVIVEADAELTDGAPVEEGKR